MAKLAEPIAYGLNIYQGTDHSWQFRRIAEDGTPIIPDNAFAQVRDKPNGTLWATLVATNIDPETGWITLELGRAATTGDAWYTRHSGVWDLEVLVNNRYYRWAMGPVTVSHEVTK